MNLDTLRKILPTLNRGGVFELMAIDLGNIWDDVEEGFGKTIEEVIALDDSAFLNLYRDVFGCGS
jgi:hypothetical protein